jgi:type VI secretion system protein ImpK
MNINNTPPNSNQNDDSTIIFSVGKQPIALAPPANEKKEVAPVNPFVVSRKLTSSNRLLESAQNILAVISELKRPQEAINLSKLRQALTLEIKSFDLKAKNAGIPESTVLLARYAICAVIDEFVLDTPWGANSEWSLNSLLSSFHQDSAGGQKFFVILDRMLEESEQQIEMLELFYICISLGFVGKYRIVERGYDQLAALKARVYNTLYKLRQEPDRTPSVNVVAAVPKKVNRFKPIKWFRLVLLMIIVLTSIYLVFHFWINREGSRVQHSFEKIMVGSTLLEKSSS